MADLKLPLTAASSRQPEPELKPSRRSSWWLKTVLFAAAVLLTLASGYSSLSRRPAPCQHALPQSPPLPQCQAQPVIGPSARPDITENNVQGLFRSAAFRNLSASRLAGAVQIPTEDFQDMGRMGEDPRWDAFYDLQKYFEDTFPLLHEKLQFEVINEHGLLYTWRGSNATLKPVLLMSHQDTVPVAADTLSEWRYPPFSGHFDGTYINGRGSHDCKNNVVAILSALTALLEQGFVPQRTVVAAFGFDEEATKFRYGAARLADHLREVYGGGSGGDAFAIIVDEGGLGVNRQFGRTFATPETSEKGYLDVVLDVHVPGGHSSIPPAHTAIGILAAAVARLEAEADANFVPRLAADNPLYALLRCAADDAATVDMSPALRAALRGPQDEAGLGRVAALLADDAEAASLLHTSQAVTIFHAGSKANSLPAYASALVNYRVASDESLAQVREKLVRTVRPVAEQMGVRFLHGPEGGGEKALPLRSLRLSWKDSTEREPSPVSPTTSPCWTALAGVIKHVFDEPGFGNDVLVAPMYAGGNTDTLFFWDLSSQIYRFGPVRAWHDEGWGNIHDVNERIALDAHMEAILFYHEFIRVFDEADLD